MTALVRPFLYTHTTVPHGRYAAETKASVLEPLGIVWNGETPRLWLTEEERADARALLSALGLRDGQRLISVDATHRRASKRWPAERFAETLDRLHRRDPALRFFLLRGPGEDEEARALRERCACQSAILLPDRAPDLRHSAAIMEQAALHLGTCSAPRHIAAAMGTPSVVIPGASGPEWTCPGGSHVELRPDLPCQPCHKTDCATPRCLTLITPEQVEQAVADMLE